MNRDLTVLDWLSFTYKLPGIEDDVFLFDRFLEDLPEFQKIISDMEMISAGRTHYQYVLAFDTMIRIAYSESSRMGVHVDIPSHGIDRFCELFGLKRPDDFVSLYDCFKLLSERHCKVTRCDLCFDDYTFFYKPWDLMLAYKEGRTKSYCRQVEYIGNGNKGLGTFYLGQRSTGRLLRVYDKNYESKGEIPAIRWELEYRGHYARALQDKILSDSSHALGFGDLVCSFFNILDGTKFDEHGYYNKEISSDWTNFWKNLMFNEEFEGLKLPKKEVSAQRIFNWFASYIAPSLGVIASCLDSFQMSDFLRRCKGELKPRHLKMIQRYRDEALAMSHPLLDEAIYMCADSDGFRKIQSFDVYIPFDLD